MRTLEVDDLFRIEQIGRYYGGPFSFSPAGGTLAYVLQRPKETATLHTQRPLAGNDRADIWLVELPAGIPRNLTEGVTDGAGYWAPAWSPDGARLAMLSNRGGNVRLWVWEKATGQLRQLTQRGVRLDFSNVPYAWLSIETILCPVLAEGEQPEPMNLEARAPERAMRAWPKVWAGREDTGRYLLNSPNFFVDRVQTPLLIIHGDMDYIPIQQGEEFFMGLYRQGKRAAFVRYWGEGHVPESLANIRDMWQRILGWFEQAPGAGAG
jgi:dipeptidyl aminopeptidase/acylaminoacyl peptidase